MNEPTKMSPRRIAFFESHHVVDDSGCWLWTGQINRTGYGQFTIMEGGKRISTVAHRIVFEHFNHKIPEGLVLDHLCRVRNCINPDHLEPVTNRENILRGAGESIIRHFSAECVAGHPLEGDNLRLASNGRRWCRKCSAIYRQTYYQRLADRGETPSSVRRRAKLRDAADQAEGEV